MKFELKDFQTTSARSILDELDEARVAASKGKLQAVVEAPECVYAPLDGEANSADHLRLKLLEGRITVEGDGFFWRQSDNSLDISNNVFTLVKTGTWKPFTP